MNKWGVKMKISYVPVVDAMEVMNETNAQFGTDYLWVNLVPEMQENDSYFADAESTASGQ